MNLKKIHHVAIIASDYKKSKDFYVNLLGLKIIREVYREERDSYKLDLEIGDSQIELFSFKNPPKRQSYPEACGLRHIAFEVENIEKQVRELKDKGIKVEEIRIDEFTGRKFTFFSDPDDLPIELYERGCIKI
ncbi:SMU1112c/YaeR family gloxylase I-like metalloprotein [Clostridium perfringens]|uniref:SMU1112c/YaeR family gloxylase I-like metalloprotein n=1 Tax=Clostridium perfringens TaxID=1502 RepID=UPI001A20E3A6|nr:VOC family protein [Clostridium perfringens]HAT4243731.1 VOC family protein [Clostridium perfringens]